MDINFIKSCQQNRHPLLFLDQIINIVPGEKCSSLKCFSYNEWFFPAHFEDEPNVPGFILIESMVQCFIMTCLSLDEFKGSKTNFLGANNVKFRRKIVPGEVLINHAELVYFKRGIAKGSVTAYVDSKQACSADFTVTLPNILEQFKPK